MVDLRGQKLARRPGRCPPPPCPERLSWLALAAMEMQPSMKTRLVAFRQLGWSLGWTFPPCITQDEHRAWGVSSRQQNEVLKARWPLGELSVGLPRCLPDMGISPEGDGSPKRTRRWRQHSGLSAWDSCAVSDYRFSQLKLCLRTAALQHVPVLSSALFSLLYLLLAGSPPGALRRSCCH